MNEIPSPPEAAPAPLRSSYWAIALVELALLIFLAWQLSSVWKQKSLLADQKQQRQRMADEARNNQVALQNLAGGLLDLARTDPEARALVEKYQIRAGEPTQTR
jgi:heme exporter protein D